MTLHDKMNVSVPMDLDGPLGADPVVGQRRSRDVTGDPDTKEPVAQRARTEAWNPTNQSHLILEALNLQWDWGGVVGTVLEHLETLTPEEIKAYDADETLKKWNRVAQFLHQLELAPDLNRLAYRLHGQEGEVLSQIRLTPREVDWAASPLLDHLIMATWLPDAHRQRLWDEIELHRSPYDEREDAQDEPLFSFDPEKDYDDSWFPQDVWYPDDLDPSTRYYTVAKSTLVNAYGEPFLDVIDCIRSRCTFSRRDAMDLCEALLESSNVSDAFAQREISWLFAKFKIQRLTDVDFAVWMRRSVKERGPGMAEFVLTAYGRSHTVDFMDLFTTAVSRANAKVTPVLPMLYARAGDTSRFAHTNTYCKVVVGLLLVGEPEFLSAWLRLVPRPPLSLVQRIMLHYLECVTTAKWNESGNSHLAIPFAHLPMHGHSGAREHPWDANRQGAAVRVLLDFFAEAKSPDQTFLQVIRREPNPPGHGARNPEEEHDVVLERLRQVARQLEDTLAGRQWFYPIFIEEEDPFTGVVSTTIQFEIETRDENHPNYLAPTPEEPNARELQVLWDMVHEMVRFLTA